MFVQVGSGERFGSDAGGPVDNVDTVPFSDEEDRDGDDEWEDVEEWNHVSHVFRQQRWVMLTCHVAGLMTRVRDRERALSGDMISDLGPVIDPLNHNCISVYNKRKAMGHLHRYFLKLLLLSLS